MLRKRQRTRMTRLIKSLNATSWFALYCLTQASATSSISISGINAFSTIEKTCQSSALCWWLMVHLPYKLSCVEGSCVAGISNWLLLLRKAEGTVLVAFLLEAAGFLLDLVALVSWSLSDSLSEEFNSSSSASSSSSSLESRWIILLLVSANIHWLPHCLILSVVVITYQPFASWTCQALFCYEAVFVKKLRPTWYESWWPSWRLLSSSYHTSVLSSGHCALNRV